MKHLYKSNKNKVCCGVCGGFGEFLDIDPTIVRLVWVLFTLLSVGVGIILYLIACIIMPNRR